MKRLAVFISGSGSNFRKIHEGTLAGEIQAAIKLVITNNPDCAGAEYARAQQLAVYKYPARDLGVDDLLQQLSEVGIDILLLAGYIKLVPQEVVARYPRRILNIHPALLPRFGGKGFYGRKVHEAVLAAGERKSGPSVHFVDEKYDHGAVVAQAAVPVLPDDTPETLAQRVLTQEHILYPKVVAALCRGDIHWAVDNRPVIDPPLDMNNLIPRQEKA
ncbi:phosphoribosylglycinamide formyltransferase [Candidatus Neomarinimicrobiota bacterium]